MLAIAQEIAKRYFYFYLILTKINLGLVFGERLRA
jgi:hypothetical protein